MIKHTNGLGISKNLNPGCKLFVRKLPGATTQCMDDYVKPSIRTQIDHFILHVETNDLILNTRTNWIAKKLFT